MYFKPKGVYFSKTAWNKILDRVADLNGIVKITIEADVPGDPKEIKDALLSFTIIKCLAVNWSMNKICVWLEGEGSDLKDCLSGIGTYFYNEV